MWLFELLFFAGLALFLFTRLWSVLGTRDGFEQKVENDQESGEEQPDNVIVLHQKTTSQSEPHEDFKEEAKDTLSKIKRFDPNFFVDEFLTNAKHAFSIILKAYIDNDQPTLELLLAESVLKQFKQAIQARIDANQTVTNEIVGNIQAFIHEVSLEGSQALIIVKFISEQCHITYDSEGKILDNPAKISIQLTDYWSFKRDLFTADNNIWKLVQTRTQSNA